MCSMIAVIDGFSAAGMYGREDDRRTVLDLLQRVARGGGGVVLAEGEPGIGKSVLLRTAVDEAATRGFSLAAGAADQLGRTIPLFALRAALGEPFARFTAGHVERDERSPPGWWIGRMRAHLEQQAAAHPVLACLDDVEWTCPATLAALRTLPREPGLRVDRGNGRHRPGPEPASPPWRATAPLDPTARPAGSARS